MQRSHDFNVTKNFKSPKISAEHTGHVIMDVFKEYVTVLDVVLKLFKAMFRKRLSSLLFEFFKLSCLLYTVCLYFLHLVI